MICAPCIANTDASVAAAAMFARRATVMLTLAVAAAYVPSDALVAVTVQVSLAVPAVAVLPDNVHVPAVIA